MTEEPNTLEPSMPEVVEADEVIEPSPEAVIKTAPIISSIEDLIESLESNPKTSRARSALLEAKLLLQSMK